MSHKSFYSKVLLFGEYSVIQHSMALSIPYTLFEGRLKFPRDKSKGIDPELKAFCQYLKKLPISLIDTKSFEFDLGQGLFFHSTIPQGFGVGSSGALVAAVYDRYAKEKIPLEQLSSLKDLFAQMESHFHGSSSGLDPLISYLGQSLLVYGKKDYRAIDLPKYGEGQGGLFLLNTGRPRRTEPLVNLFLEKCRQDSFIQNCMNKLIPVNDSCIESFLNQDTDKLLVSMRELSQIQYDHFAPMIPPLYQDTWKKGLESDLYNLKLCGAGGGGFLLGSTRDFSKLEQTLDGHEIRPLFTF
tara:strand:+ start:433 stop:1326 length:894 start_codon:yes stop_codon:yes gene_type:complete